MESSEYWAASVAQRFNLSLSDVRALWNDTALKTSYDYKAMGLVTGIKYNDQVNSLTHSLTHVLTHSLTHALTCLLTHSLLIG